MTSNVEMSFHPVVSNTESGSKVSNARSKAKQRNNRDYYSRKKGDLKQKREKKKMADRQNLMRIKQLEDFIRENGLVVPHPCYFLENDSFRFVSCPDDSLVNPNIPMTPEASENANLPSIPSDLRNIGSEPSIADNFDSLNNHTSHHEPFLDVSNEWRKQ
ncbi:15504_t:CDS:2 [Acaulospora morrowiae]|uniref:15504_t:CDS:1 n=1 Tax=Acaulospora morrowiae TaxID=94023 RepID=A0A9N9AKC5_9GLOM|nr:15504_t:CDS:2 [Acaulospora morrowiae]